MIKLEHVVLASPEQMEFIIEGMRNPMNSWDKSDSEMTLEQLVWRDEKIPDKFKLGPDDHSLMQRLANTGTDHRKFMRMLPVYVRITAPLYWWKEFDTYKVGTVANSCSTMHKIQAKEFTLDDFSTEHLFTEGQNVYCKSAPLEEDDLFINSNQLMLLTVEVLNQYREDFLKTKDKRYRWQMIQLLPSSYNQTRNVMMNYEVLANIYNSRKDHKLDEWVEFCNWIKALPYQELITGEDNISNYKEEK